MNYNVPLNPSQRQFTLPTRRKVLSLVTILAFLAGLACGGSDSPGEADVFSFITTADMRQFAGPEYQTAEYFLGTCEAIKEVGKGAFMVSPGDIDPPQHVYATITKVLGADYPWYPVVGNHESETPEDMDWLREYGKGDLPFLVRRGPPNCEETCFSFDYKNAHLVVINQYYDGLSDIGTNGNVTKPLYDWLKRDLQENDKPMVFVFGHEPIVSLPDMDSGRHRHKGDNLDAHPDESHLFQELLREFEVTAYVYGHTHNFSYANINGIWQFDTGHCRGVGDRGAPSTFLKFHVASTSCTVDVYRDDSNGGPYSLIRTIKLD